MTMSELQGRVALVTGAARGIGAATARALAAKGAKVILTDLGDASGLAAELGGLSRRQDVTDEADWAATIAFARAEAGGLDILVNKAGVLGGGGPTSELSLEEWRRVQAVNVEGVFLGCKHAIPVLAERAGQWTGGAAIVNLSSVAGLVGFAGAACYGASKGAVRLMTKCLALELAPRRIRVNSVHPGGDRHADGPASAERRGRRGGDWRQRGPGDLGRAPPAGRPRPRQQHRRRHRLPGFGQGGVHDRLGDGGGRRPDGAVTGRG